MSEFAFDPDSTPNTLAEVPGQDVEVSELPPTAPHPVGETFTDEEGQPRHVKAPSDGSAVTLQFKSEETS